MRFYHRKHESKRMKKNRRRKCRRWKECGWRTKKKCAHCAHSIVRSHAMSGLEKYTFINMLFTGIEHCIKKKKKLFDKPSFILLIQSQGKPLELAFLSHSTSGQLVFCVVITLTSTSDILSLVMQRAMRQTHKSICTKTYIYFTHIFRCRFVLTTHMERCICIESTLSSYIHSSMCVFFH